jgi:ribosome-associated translation inhibitor RaiA
MASKKPSSGAAWQVIVEEMRSQNRATIEVVEAFRMSIEERIERLDRESHDRDSMLAQAISGLRRLGEQHGADIAELKRMGQGHGVDIRDLKVTVQENTVELRTLARKMEALNRLEERVAALEKRVQ